MCTSSLVLLHSYLIKRVFISDTIIQEPITIQEYIIAEDCNDSEIYMPGLYESDIRVWNLHHYCMYCAYGGANVSRHLRNKHSDENEVAEILIMELSGKDKDIQKDFAIKLEFLRMRGDHKHNLNVVEKKIRQHGRCSS